MFRGLVIAKARYSISRYRSAYGRAPCAELLRILESEHKALTSLRRSLNGLYTTTAAHITNDMVNDAAEARRVLGEYLIRFGAAIVDVERGKIPSPELLEC